MLNQQKERNIKQAFLNFFFYFAFVLILKAKETFVGG